MSATKKLFVSVVSALAIAPCAGHAATPSSMPTTSDQWRASAIRDTDAGYKVTLANHAGTLDPHNPAFLDNLNAAKEFGESLASKVSDGSGYYAALLGFSNRIHDGHAGVYPAFDLNEIKPRQWPGFVVAWRGDLFVYASEAEAARQGERIVSCDDKPIRQLLEENVFRYLGRADEEGQWCVVVK